MAGLSFSTHHMNNLARLRALHLLISALPRRVESATSGGFLLPNPSCFALKNLGIKPKLGDCFLDQIVL